MNIKELINSKGLTAYIVFVVTILGAFIYLQFNGIQLYNSTKTEHDESAGTYGSTNHK